MSTIVAESSPSLRDRARALVESPRFDVGIILLIIANALTLGAEASPALLARYGAGLHAFDRLALGVFVFELLLRF